MEDGEDPTLSAKERAELREAARQEARRVKKDPMDLMDEADQRVEEDKRRLRAIQAEKARADVVFPAGEEDPIVSALRVAEPQLSPERGLFAVDRGDVVDPRGNQSTRLPTGEITSPRQPQKHLPIQPYITIKAKDPADNSWRLYEVHGHSFSSSSSLSSSSQSSVSTSPSPSSSSPSSSSHSVSSSSSPNPSSSSLSSKFAIVPYEDTWIGWQCAEEPGAKFFDTLEITTNFFGFGSAWIAPEFTQSVEPGSIRVISVLSPHVPAVTSGRIHLVTGRLLVRAHTGFFRPPAGRVVVRIEGVRRNSVGRFHEFTEEQAIHNNAFWAKAYDTGRGEHVG